MEIPFTIYSIFFNIHKGGLQEMKMNFEICFIV